MYLYKIIQFVCIREWKEKFDLEDNDEEDSFSFNYKNTFIFRQELSNGLTGNEIITVPHTFIWVNIIIYAS